MMRAIRSTMAHGLCLMLALAAPIGPALAPAVAQGLPAEALAEARRQAASAQRRAATLEARAGRAADAASRARAQAAAIAGRIVAAEADIAAANVRIAFVDELRARQRTRLAARQQPIVRLAAGLQAMARRPGALALVQRGSIVDLVHVRAVMAGQIPRVRARTEPLRQEVAQGLALQAEAERAAATLRDGQRRLDEERARFATIERGHREEAQHLVDSAMAEEDRATAMGEEARDIVDQMGRVEQRAALAARLAALPGPIARPPIAGQPPIAAPDPVVAGAPAYRLPVAGRLLTGTGEISDSGVRARGLTLAAPLDARVVAPAAGRIVYSGPFRDYGRIVIIDHGGGWTSLVTNLSGVRVRAGDRIAAGGPLGRAAPARGGLTVELRHDGRPVGIVPLIVAGRQAVAGG